MWWHWTTVRGGAYAEMVSFSWPSAPECLKWSGPRTLSESPYMSVSCTSTTIVDDGQELWLNPECGVRAAQEETSSGTEVLPAGTRVLIKVL
jgi:hypothetical protein